MNSFLFILFLGAVVAKNVQAASSTTQAILELKASVDKCEKEAGFTEEQLAKALANYEKNSDQKTKCFRGCLLKAHKVITDGEKIDVNAAIKFYHADKLEPLKVLVEKCTADSAGESNHCDLAEKLENCICSSLAIC